MIAIKYRKIYKIETNGFFVNFDNVDIINSKQNIEIKGLKLINDLDINYGIDTRIDVYSIGYSVIPETYGANEQYVKYVIVSLNTDPLYNDPLYFHFRNLLLGELRKDKLDYLIE